MIEVKILTFERVDNMEAAIEARLSKGWKLAGAVQFAYDHADFGCRLRLMATLTRETHKED